MSIHPVRTDSKNLCQMPIKQLDKVVSIVTFTFRQLFNCVVMMTVMINDIRILNM